LITARCSGHIIDHGPGALLPVLVNAHTHLELCALKGKVLPEKGFMEWIKNLLNLRNLTSTETLKKGAKNGVNELIASGCGVIGEIYQNQALQGYGSGNFLVMYRLKILYATQINH